MPRAEYKPFHASIVTVELKKVYINNLTLGK